MAITITRDLNVVSVGVPPVIHLSQYDSNFTLVFNLYASTGEFTMPTGTTAEIRGTKRDGNGYDAAATVSGSTVTVTGDEQMTAVAGQNVFEIATYYNNKRLNTINFILDVERAALDADTITSESVLRELNAIIEGAATATQAAEDAKDAADRAEEAADDLSGTVQQVATNTHDIADLKDDLYETETETIDIFTTIPAINQTLFTTSDVEVGDTIQYHIKFVGNDVGYIGLYNSQNTIIGYYGKASYSETATVFDGDFNVPDGFSYAKWVSNTIRAQEFSLVKIIIDGRVNILDNVVRFDKSQALTDTQKAQARENIGIVDGLSDEAKIALLDCFKHVYWMDHDSDYYGALEEALYDEPVPPTPTPLYDWDFTKSLADKISGQVAVLRKNTNGTLPTRDSSGVHFDAYGQSIQLFGDTATLEQTLKNRTIQVDVASFTPNSANDNHHTRFIMFSKSKADIDNQVFNVGIIYRYNGNPAQWSMYTSDPSAASGSWGSGFGITNRNAISGHTVSVYIGNDYKPKLYIDDQSYGTGNLAFYPNMVGLFVGSNDTASQGATFYDALVTGVRIYEGDVVNGI